MTLKYLYKHLIQVLDTKIRFIQNSDLLISQFCLRPELNDALICTPEIIAKYTALLSNSRIPLLLEINNLYVYAFIPINTQTVILGPVQLSHPLQLRHKLTLSLSVEENNFLIQNITTVNSIAYIKQILLLINSSSDPSCDSEITLSDFIKENSRESVIPEIISGITKMETFQRNEFESYHNPYDQEFREQQAIERGDLKALKQAFSESYSGKLGTMSSSPLQNIKNLAIVSITLASRSAIRGGVPPEVSYTFSDQCMLKLDHMSDSHAILQFSRDLEYEYAKLVKNYQLKQNIPDIENEHITNCINYIYRHLHQKLTVKEIAAALNVTPNYLSSLFVRIQGITLTRYIMKQKIIIAKNLLTYSAYTTTEIAQYLGFSSQSHFGKYFKEYTKFTPREYRIHYQMQEFIG